jgi:hypothetical protein
MSFGLAPLGRDELADDIVQSGGSKIIKGSLNTKKSSTTESRARRRHGDITDATAVVAADFAAKRAPSSWLPGNCKSLGILRISFLENTT